MAREQKKKAATPPGESAPGWPTMARSDLIPWPELNPRHLFNDDDLAELRETLVSDGMLQPVGVKLNAEPPHWIFAGERRWRAAEGVLQELPVAVRDIDEAAARRLALTENIQRSALTPMEEAWGIARYVDVTGATQTEVGEQLGKTQGWVSNRLRLLRLSDEIQTMVQEGTLTATQARDLILPFSSLPPEMWSVFLDGVDSGLAKQARKVRKKEARGLTDEEVRLCVSAVACAMSGWLDSPLQEEGWEEKQHERWRLKVLEDRWKGAPSGTVIAYLYGTYADRRTSRAFDHRWWSGEIQRDRQRLVKRREKLIAEGEEAIADPADLDWSAELGPIPADVEVPHHTMHLVYEPQLADSADAFALYADPTDLEASTLVLREGPGGKGYKRQDMVLCTDYAAYEAAVTALEEKRRTLVERERAAAHRKVEKEAAAIDLSGQGVAGALLAAGWACPIDRWEDPVSVACDVLGIQVWLERDACAGRTATEEAEVPADMGASFLRWFLALEDAVRTRMLQIIVWMVLHPDNAVGHVAQDKVRARLKKSLAAELAAKVSFDLPTWKEAVTHGDKAE